MGGALSAAFYGGVRGRISDAIAPFASKIPLGTIAEEAALATSAFFIAKKVKNKQVKNVARAALIIESARIGEAIADGSAFRGMAATGDAPSGNIF